MSDTSNAAKLREIYLQVIEIEDDAARVAYLDEACGVSSPLRRQVEKMLTTYQQNSPRLLHQAVVENRASGGLDEVHMGETNLSNPHAMGDYETSDEPIAGPLDIAQNPKIGPYTIREQIGEGGMGYVYVAEQTKPVRRKVALKVIKPGMDTKEVVARFEAERQALAMMSHPNIAKVLDGGATDQGRPYFVMELVRGEPITKFCDQHKLTPRERLDLFLKVCQAVQHAHMKGIIHRDLKPSNVIVEVDDVRPIPKVIDFGVAKATGQQLSKHTVYTQFSQLVGTPLYMSPEQAKQSSTDIDTRSDIYSLGVMLYELLTGTTPFDKATLSSVNITELQRIICEDDPPRPSARISTLKSEQLTTISSSRKTEGKQLQLSMQRELDWIVMKALEKDRTRRYEAASAMAADIQRYLDHEPVEAHPPSVAYKLKKYAGRHKGLLTTAALLIGMLITSTAVSGVFAYQANGAKQEAEEQKAEAVEAKDLADERLAAEQKARQQAKEQQEKATRNFEAALDAVDKLLAQVGKNDLEEIPHLQTMRQQILEDALAFYDEFSDEIGDSPEVRVRAASTWGTLGDLAGEMGQQSNSRRAYEEAVGIAEQLVRESKDNLRYRELLAELLMHASHRASEATIPGSRQLAIDYMRRSVREYSELYRLDPKNNDYRFELGRTVMQLEVFLRSQPQTEDERVALRNQGLRLLEEARLNELDDNQLAAVSYRLMKEYLHSNPERADRHLRERIAALRRQAERSGQRGHRLGLANCLGYAAAHLASRDASEAETLWRESLQILESLVTDFPHSVKHGDRYSQRISQFAGFLRRNERNEEAEELVVGALERFPLVPELHRRRIDWLARNGKLEEAIRLGQESVERMPDSWFLHKYHAQNLIKQANTEQVLADLTRHIELYPEISCYYRWRGHLKRQLGALDESLDDLNLAVELIPEEESSEKYYTYLSRGKTLLKLGQIEQAISDLSMMLADYKDRDVRSFRAFCYFRNAQYDEALLDLREAVHQDGKGKGNIRHLLSIPPSDVAECTDDEFRRKYLELMNEAVQLDKNSADSLATRAAIRIAFGQFEQGRADLNTILALEDAGYYPHYQAALLSIHLDEPSQYKSVCGNMITDFSESENNFEIHFTAWTCALAPDALDDYEPAIKLARHVVEKEPGNQQYLDGLGAILLRAGKYEEAKEQLEKALEAGENDNTSPSYIHYFLAMTEHHLGNADTAKEHLTKANESAERELDDSPAWNRKLTLELLRKEAEALIDGEDEPSNKSEEDQPEND